MIDTMSTTALGGESGAASRGGFARSGAVAALCAGLMLGAPGALAALVHIQAEGVGGLEQGAGYTAARESDCFVVTPRHVVVHNGIPATSIRLTDSRGRRAGARVVRDSEDFDAALLEVVEGADQIECASGWARGDEAVDLINEAEFLIARKVGEDGTTTQVRLFATSTSPDLLQLAPYTDRDQLVPGDSGSALYAGNQLVGIVTAVNTATGEVEAVVQTRIHGLFGADILPSGVRAVVIRPFVAGRVPDQYATAAAREYAMDHHRLDVVASVEGNASLPGGADFVLAGEILSVSSAAEENPDYREPVRQSRRSGGLRGRLTDLVEREAREGLQEQTGINTAARYVHKYAFDVLVAIDDLRSGAEVRSLEEVSIVVPDDNPSPAATRNRAVHDAVRQAIEAAVARHGLL